MLPIFVVVLLLSLFANSIGSSDHKDTYINAFALSHGVNELNSIRDSSDRDSSLITPNINYESRSPHIIKYEEIDSSEHLLSHVKRWLDNVHIQFDILQILKFLLKILIFKKVVSFFGVLCLLLFMPYLTAGTASIIDAAATNDSKMMATGFVQKSFPNNSTKIATSF